jgi:putative ABC transport system substrate-binding protein
MMDRRAFIGSLGLGALATPGDARAQPARSVARIGILSFAGTAAEITGPDPSRPSIKAFLRGLHEAGYVYGRDFVTEPRAGEGRPELWPAMVAELVRLKVDVIVAPGPNLAELKQATSTIPIVMAAATDPVGDGYVRSLGRPGTNFTGLSLQESDTMGKRLELLKELVPSATPVAIFWATSNSVRAWQAADAAAEKRGWKLLKVEIRDASAIEGAFKTAAGARAGAVLMAATSVMFSRARQVSELAAANRLPAMYGLRSYVEAGGLISYGADINEIWRRAATFVVKILKGARPAELPVEQPSKFELVLNGKAARALGLTVPPALLARVDQVVDSL